jgi:hypothetical protein
MPEGFGIAGAAIRGVQGIPYIAAPGIPSGYLKAYNLKPKDGFSV